MKANATLVRLDDGVDPIRVEAHSATPYILWVITTPLPFGLSMLCRKDLLRVDFARAGGKSLCVVLPMMNGFGGFQTLSYDENARPAVAVKALHEAGSNDADSA
jgi:hypothetical protein